MGRSHKADEDYNRKRRRVVRLLRSPKWASRSTNWIAMMAGVSWLFADKIRCEVEQDRPITRESRSGRQYTSSYAK